MLNELFLFLIFFCVGLISRLYYRAMNFILNKMNNRAATITIEFFSVGILALIIFGAAFFVGSGVVLPFMVITLAVGYTLTSIFI